MSTSTRITTPFDRHSTAEDVSEGVDLTGKRAIVTGGAIGIGIETARALALRGADVTITARDLEAGQRAVDDIKATTGNDNVRVAELELISQDSIDAFVAGWEGPLHILVNNAGVFGPPLIRTPEGWELQFATNFFGHFALTNALHPALAEAGRAGGARLVAVSSNAHAGSSIVYDDIHYDERPYDPWSSYAQSKTAVILLAVEAARRWAGDGITANALHPGGIRTAVLRHTSDEVLDEVLSGTGGLEGHDWKTPEEGAATSVLLAASPLVDGVTGAYFEDCNQALPYEDGGWSGVAEHALDPAAAQRLWDFAVETLAKR